MIRFWWVLHRFLDTFLDRFWWIFHPNLVPKNHQNRDKIGAKMLPILESIFGSILNRFGEGSERVLGRFWEGLACFWMDFPLKRYFSGCFWKRRLQSGPTGAELINGTPSLIREASQCAGVLPQRGKTVSP